MGINNLSPNFPTYNLEETIEFYTSKLGFKVVTLEKGWVMMERQGAVIMFTKNDKHQPDCNNYYKMFVKLAENIESYYNTLEQKCLKSLSAIKSTKSNFKEFSVKDNNDYELLFAQFGNRMS